MALGALSHEEMASAAMQQIYRSGGEEREAARNKHLSELRARALGEYIT